MEIKTACAGLRCFKELLLAIKIPVLYNQNVKL